MFDIKPGVFEICRVLPGSIAEESDIKPGDILLSINGEQIRDIFDYRFLITNEEIVLEIQKPDGEIWEIEVEKDEYEDPGMEFEIPMMDDAKSCSNKCIFCFIDQLPKGMRETVYFKDDDSRLSFLMGNYVTLTNMKYEDLDRIIKYRMSPINISVHTTNPELRIQMLRNRFAGDIMDKMRKLTDSGITVNCQIVLCRGINDGSELDRTIKDLTVLYPVMSSISVVPVGITRYRDGLAELKPFDTDSSAAVIDQVENWQHCLMEKSGSRVVYIADEFYIMAGRPIPPYSAYEDFPQIENGVGMTAMFREEFNEYLGEMKTARKYNNRYVSIATGASAYPFIRELSEILQDKFDVRIDVYEIKNCFFGENVTVSGLLTGGDIAAQLKGKPLGQELLICRSMLKADEAIFLDDITLEELSLKLGTKITPVENNGCDFIQKILGC